MPKAGQVLWMLEINWLIQESLGLKPDGMMKLDYFKGKSQMCHLESDVRNFYFISVRVKLGDVYFAVCLSSFLRICTRLALFK